MCEVLLLFSSSTVPDAGSSSDVGDAGGELLTGFRDTLGAGGDGVTNLVCLMAISRSRRAAKTVVAGLPLVVFLRPLDLDDWKARDLARTTLSFSLVVRVLIPFVLSSSMSGSLYDTNEAILMITTLQLSPLQLGNG